MQIYFYFSIHLLRLFLSSLCNLSINDKIGQYPTKFSFLHLIHILLIACACVSFFIVSPYLINSSQYIYNLLQKYIHTHYNVCKSYIRSFSYILHKKNGDLLSSFHIYTIRRYYNCSFHLR